MTLAPPRPTIGRDDRFRTGDWIVDPSRNLLRSGDEEQRLGNRIMSLLVFLAGARGQVLLKEEILEEVWEGRIVSDDALTVAVYSLRKSLGDTAEESFYIETIPGRGYRWRAPVEVLGPGEDSGSGRPDSGETGPAPAGVAPEADPELDAGAPDRRRGRRWALAVLAAAGLAAVVGLLLRGGEGRPPTISGDVRTIAVLPLQLDDGTSRPLDDPEAVFARGISELLLSSLERGLPAFAIQAPRGNAEGWASIPPPRLAREASADLVVAGTVGRSGGRLRIAAELLGSGEAESLGPVTAEGDVEDVVSVVAGLTRDLAALMAAAGLPVELRLPAATARTVDPEALALYFRALALRGDTRPVGLAGARELALGAVAVDPTLVEAHLLLVDLTFQRVWWGLGSLDDERALASRAAASARALDPGSPHALTAGALARILEWKLDAAEELLQQAVRTSPSLAEPHSTSADLLLGQGRFVEATARSREAAALRPRDPNPLLKRSWILASSGDAEGALAAVEQAEALGAVRWAVALFRSHALHALGRDLDGCREHLRSVRLRQGDEVADGLLGALEQGGTPAYYGAFLELVGRQIPPLDRIRNLLRAGEEEGARSALEAFVETEHPILLLAAHDAGLAPMRGRPDWDPLFERIDAVIAAGSS